ncbi:MAG TPA: VOC family protein [Dongiaceae bacterium]|nr:VOC family protein [Dongiaceae bacterium]
MRGFDLDHVGIAVADLDAAAAKLRRLGFRLTPRGYHTLPPETPGAERPRVGTGNHCAMLRRGYVEVIGVTDAAYRGRLRADIARYEGVHVIAFGTDDAAASAKALRAAGIEAAGPRPLERPVEEEGKVRLARFEIVDFPEDSLPEGHFFAIRHATPELLWKESLLDQPNGAVSLETLTVAVADSADFARRLGRILAVSPQKGDGLLLKLRAGRVRVVDGGWVAANLPGKTPDLPYIAGIGLGVADIGRTADVLAQNGVRYQREPGSLTVAPADACGAFIAFQSPG